MGRWADGAVLLVPPSFQINALPTLQAHVDVSELFDPKGAVGAGSGARAGPRITAAYVLDLMATRVSAIELAIDAAVTVADIGAVTEDE